MTSTSIQLSNDCYQIPDFDVDESESEHPPQELLNSKLEDLMTKGDELSSESPSHSINVPISPHRWSTYGSQPHKWGKLRTALNVSSMITKRTTCREESTPKLERKDSFLERFSNFRGENCPENPTSVIEQQTNKQDSSSSSTISRKSSPFIPKKHSTLQSKLLISQQLDEEANCMQKEKHEKDLLLPLTDKLTYLVDKKDCDIETKSVFFMWDPQGFHYLLWLTCVSLAVMYNLWITILRQAFPEELKDNYKAMWFMLDIVADMIYVLDILVQFRTSYLKIGLAVLNQKKLAKRYMASREFLLDVLALLPLDLIQIKTGIIPLIRFPRFLKLYRAWRWKLMVENRSVFPNLWRVVNLSHILFLGCHWFAAFYYMLSKSGNFENSWGYPNPALNAELNTLARKYLQSFHWATVTLTTIGDNKDSSFRGVQTNCTYVLVNT
ncbi:hypothetical protein Ciccas_010579 [Cichlidogyrus casuarinus]|uniref:Ion transport domain-containing protein n=1 Tax=Cichlidogyrus casuarinus TaxID=1844966 RepID=A0ABD2PUW5_9PLAT